MNRYRSSYWIIESLLDTDLYKLTMLQAFYHAPEFRAVEVEWKFGCRNRKQFDLASMIPEIRRQLEHVCSLSFTEDELKYLTGLSYFSSDFIDYLRSYRLTSQFVHLHKSGEDLDLRIRGPLVSVALFEIFLLAIISELHTFANQGGISPEKARKILEQKISLLQEKNEMEGFAFVDFGTRRRASRSWHQEVLETLKEKVPHYFSGTSSVYFAKTLGLTPIGTMAHEWFQAWQAVSRLEDAQKDALAGWVREYKGQLGIALTDCYSMDSFIRDFHNYDFPNIYNGLRHDSGSPAIWAKKALEMYHHLGIDPKTKTFVFSDGLDFPKMLELYTAFHTSMNVAFGIGTNLTNDVGNTPLDIVIKMVAANGKPVAKISDEPGKSMCEDREFLKYLANIYGIDLKEKDS